MTQDRFDGHTAGCPSGLALARLASRDGYVAGEAAVSCRRCAERLREIEEAREELFGRDPGAIAAAARLIARELDERADEPAIESDAWFDDRFDH